MSTIKLTNPTDDELSAAVAEHVAGWRIHHRNTSLWCKAAEQSGLMESGAMGTVGGLRFATSADAVLPLLEKHDWRSECVMTSGSPTGRNYRIEITGNVYGLYFISKWCPTFTRAACIALLRANGIDVEVAP